MDGGKITRFAVHVECTRYAQVVDTPTAAHYVRWPIEFYGPRMRSRSAIRNDGCLIFFGDGETPLVPTSKSPNQISHLSALAKRT